MNLVHALHRLYLKARSSLQLNTTDVRCILTRTDGRVLLVRHTYSAGWFFPGGTQERKETPEAAMARELKEEIGLAQPQSLRLFHTYQDRNNPNGRVVVFAAEAFTGPLKTNHEIAEAAFFEAHAPPEGTSPATLRRLREWRGEARPSREW